MFARQHPMLSFSCCAGAKHTYAGADMRPHAPQPPASPPTCFPARLSTRLPAHPPTLRIIRPPSIEDEANMT